MKPTYSPFKSFMSNVVNINILLSFHNNNHGEMQSQEENQ